jgi:23S rRNA (adenine1618-N6)-methyltransferase
MIQESVLYQKQVKWFTTLVSKEDNLKSLSKSLEKYQAKIKIQEMTQGQKVSRLLCWSF